MYFKFRKVGVKTQVGNYLKYSEKKYIKKIKTNANLLSAPNIIRGQFVLRWDILPIHDEKKKKKKRFKNQISARAQKQQMHY